jgi:hypothetical protein
MSLRDVHIKTFSFFPIADMAIETGGVNANVLELLLRVAIEVVS